MNEVLVVVLVVGVVLFASYFFRRRGYSPNQRIVLSGVAAVLLLWTGRNHMAESPTLIVFYAGGAALLIYSAVRLGRSNKSL